LRLHLCLRAVADADHRNDRTDADDNAKRGQGGAQFVPTEGAASNLKSGTQSHYWKWRSRTGVLQRLSY
jgi:hypothetical protein